MRCLTLAEAWLVGYRSTMIEVAGSWIADVDFTVASARAALRGWSTAAPVARSTVLAKLPELVTADADVFIAEEVAQTGKPVRLCPRNSGSGLSGPRLPGQYTSGTLTSVEAFRVSPRKNRLVPAPPPVGP
jgi:hypothetical protein